ncbi:MAG: hypothetical protein IKF11_03340 [Methanobrevibacter sp.]|nr:hypothetical protein [Methanobrevibacter sp.]
MKIDMHILFLILLAGAVSAGLVGASLMTTDTTMKQEVFDGIKVSVPSDSDFIKVTDGVYKDSKYGIVINTFKNNDSMIDYLKNTKQSKIVPVKNQPPQSVAFKKGDTLNILVTNGQEGVSVSAKDGELVSKIANNIIFSNNHKSVKPVGIGVFNPELNINGDFNLMFALIGQVNTNFFNPDVFYSNINVAILEYNQEVNEPIFNIPIVKNSDSDSDNTNDDDSVILPTNGSNDVSNINSSNDLNKALNGGKAQSSSNSPDSHSSSNAASNQPSTAKPASSSSSSSASSGSASGSSSGGSQKLSLSDCQHLVETSINGTGLKIGNYKSSGDSYIFMLLDKTGRNVKNLTVDTLTGKITQ